MFQSSKGTKIEKVIQVLTILGFFTVFLDHFLPLPTSQSQLSSSKSNPPPRHAATITIHQTLVVLAILRY